MLTRVSVKRRSWTIRQPVKKKRSAEFGKSVGQLDEAYYASVGDVAVRLAERLTGKRVYGLVGNARSTTISIRAPDSLPRTPTDSMIVSGSQEDNRFAGNYRRLIYEFDMNVCIYLYTKRTNGNCST